MTWSKIIFSLVYLKTLFISQLCKRDQNNQNYQSIARLISWDDLLKLIFPMNLRSMSYNSGKETRSYGLLVHDFLPNCMIFFHLSPTWFSDLM